MNVAFKVVSRVFTVLEIETRIESLVKKGITKLPPKYKWGPHNIVAHPIMEVLSWYDLDYIGEKIHNTTLPRKRRVVDDSP